VRTSARGGLVADGDSDSVRFPVTEPHHSRPDLADRDRHGKAERLCDAHPDRRLEPGFVASRGLPKKHRRER
jgi:hypothetical protein